MNNSRVSIQNIAGLFTIILGTHYFLSFRWFYGMLKIWGVESLSVISIEDLTFPYAYINFSVLVLTSLGFVGIIWSDFASLNRSNPLEILKKTANILMYFLLRKKKWWVNIGLLTFLGLIIFFIYKVILLLISLPNIYFWVIYVIILLVVPFIYIQFPRRKNHVIGLQLVFMFFWANSFITTILKDVSSSTNNHKIKISFEYKNQRIESSDSLIFLHHGYKYLIMKDTTGNVALYPSNLVDRIIYKDNSACSRQ